jgi:hypothetical protein
MQNAPASVVDDSGRPRIGTYVGCVPGVSWERAAGRLRRRFSGKAWHFVGIASPRAYAAFAIIDLGWVQSAFAYVFDREQRGLAADLSFVGLPGLAAQVADRAGEGARSSWRSGGAQLSLAWNAGSAGWDVHAEARGLRLEATLSTTGIPPTMCAIAAIEGGVGNCTHKTVGLAVRGRAEATGKSFDLDGATAVLDHTRGILARDTRWRWAMASKPGFGFNLVEGFNGPVENVAWIGDRVVPLGHARFEHDPRDPMRPWTIRAPEVELEFHPEGRRAEDKNLVVAASRYVQPIGTFRGRVAGVDVADLCGVTEDHAARW